MPQTLTRNATRRCSSDEDETAQAFPVRACRRSATALFTAAVLVAATFSVAEAGDARKRRTALVDAVEVCRQSAVNIHTEKTAVPESDTRFFATKARRVSGMGTGIVVDERGYIVTNYHVVHEVDDMTVTLADGSTLPARSISFDRRHDLAIIHVQAGQPLPVMPVGTSSDLMLAESVFAVGNAYGYEDSVTSGIISSLSRYVEVDETQAYERLIQTDTAINPGNSGGPLLNLNGEVIGINVAIRSGAQRIAFAIPIDDARKTIARLLSIERLNGTTHGIVGHDVKTASGSAMIVDSVRPGGPGEKAGLRKGDRIQRVRDVEILDQADLERAFLDQPVGLPIDVLVQRDSKRVQLELTLESITGGPTAVTAPATSPKSASVWKNESAQSATKNGTMVSDSTVSGDVLSEPAQIAWTRLGMRLQSIQDADRVQLKPRYNGGLRVTFVRPGSPAALHGIHDGDILLGLNGFETLNDASLGYVVAPRRLAEMPELSFLIYRKNAGPLQGTMDLRTDLRAALPARTRR